MLLFCKQKLLMMTKVFTGLVLFSIFMMGCIKGDNKCGYKDSTVIVPPAEVQALQDSLTAHQIVATASPLGFFYKIDSTGSGAGISNLCSTITVSYKGSFFNKHIFDSTATGQAATLQLGQFIVGWQKAIPLVSKGGVIDLYIPPSLAYGSVPATDQQGNVVIPANSYLVFRVSVLDIQ
jgi:FKBP-type peptidyl-prolyl cis-trans isomerase FkpA